MRIENNHIGTNAAGTAALANHRGVVINGVDAVIQDNVISGNADNGITLDPDGHRARIVGNHIGVNVTGNAALPNAQEGIQVHEADDVVIGEPGDGNVISGNSYSGINAVSGAPTGYIVQANLIGVGADGVTSLPNSPLVSEGGITVRTSASDWLIGGTGPGEGNVFANNVNQGVTIEHVNGIPDDIAILGNSIRSHNGLGIDIDSNGVTANDVGDGDTGPNGRLNFPVITSANETLGTVTVGYTLDVPAGTYRIEFFDNDYADPSGYGEGQAYLGADIVGHPGGSAAYTHLVIGDTASIITATTTEDLGAGSYGSTSEFSATRAALGATVTVNSAGNAADASPGNGSCNTGGTNSTGAPACTLRAAIAEANAHPAINRIAFNIPTSDSGHSGGVWTIAPATPLPEISAPVTIDATTQPGTVVNTAVAPNPMNGNLAVQLSGALDSVTDDWDGLRLLVAGSSGSVIRGLAFVGWDNPASDALLIWGSSNNVIAGNFIGVGASGAGDSNGVTVGVGIGGTATANRIGGTAAADRNLFAHDTPSGNVWTGVWAFGASATGTVIQGNEFGLMIGGAPVPGGSIGIHLWHGATATIGGTTSGAANRITGHSVGVIVDDDTTAARAAIVGNHIWGNSILAIDLDNNGVTANDAGDADTGPNDRLNFPVITAATGSAGTIAIEYTLDAPAGNYRIEFFDNDAAGPANHGDAQTPLAPDVITHPGGSAPYTHTVAGATGDILTATTTTDLGGGTYGVTSEVSAARLVNPPTLYPVVLDRIQKGVTTLATGATSVSVTIDAVDLSRSFLMVSLLGNSASPDNLAVSGRLVDATTVTFTRGGTLGDVVLDWSVVSFASGVSVQRGSVNLDGVTTSVPLTPVDTSRSFALTSQAATGTQFGGNGFVRTPLTTSHLWLLTTDAAASHVVHWQVVTYNDAAVQAGTAPLGPADASTTVPVSAVDTTGAWLIYTTSTANGTTANIGQKLVRGQVTNATTLTFDRSNTGQAMDVSWFLVEFTDTATVQRSSAAFLAAATAVQTSITAVDPARAIAVGGERGYGGRTAYAADDNPGTGWGTVRLVTAAAIRVQRAVTGSATADLPWQVIHWPGPATATTVTVNSTDDDDDLWPGDGYCDTGQRNDTGHIECTLRAAVSEANASATIDTIHFDIPTADSGYTAGGSYWTISPSSTLDLATGLTVDATTQPSYVGAPDILLLGTGASVGSEGFTISGDGVTVRGFAIADFPAAGVYVAALSDGAVIESNYIGTDITGTAAASHTYEGIYVDAATNVTIGGPGGGNVISGNASSGIGIDNATSVTIAGNRIGTTPDGLTPVANTFGGIRANGTSGLTIGGPGGSDANIIAGNTGDGIDLMWVTSAVIEGNTIGLAVDGTTVRANTGDGIDIGFGNTISVTGNVVSGNGSTGVTTEALNVTITDNLIGTDSTGLVDRGNGSFGIHLSGQNTVIGGPGAGNTISGNGSDGIQVSGAGIIDTTVQGNRIGVGVDGTTPLGNGFRGVAVFGARQVLLGGVGAGEGNTIAANTGAGVLVSGSADDVAVIGNAIRANGGLGIDLGGDGVTVNDAGDSDTGPNGLLNVPVLTGAEADGAFAYVTYTLDVPAGAYRVEFFANPSGADPSGHGEGETFLTSRTVNHPGGTGAHVATLTASTGDVVTATLTEIPAPLTHGSSSEFSAARTVTVAPADVAVDSSTRRSDARAAGGLTPTPPGAGIAAGGFILDGGIERLVAPATDLISGALTISAWVRLDTAGTDPRILAKTTTAGTPIYELAIDATTGELVGRLHIDNTPVEVRGGTITTGQWHNTTLTWNGTTVTLHLDGNPVDTATATGTLTTDLTAPLVIANRATADRGLDGTLDHIQVAHTAHTPARIATAEANIRQPTAFVTLGAAQTQPPGAWTTSTAHSRTGTASLAAPTTPDGADAWAVATGLNEPGIELQSWWRITDQTAIDAAAATHATGPPINHYETALTASGFDLATLLGANRTQIATPTAGLNPNTWTPITIRTDETGTSTVLINETPIHGPTQHPGGPTTGSAAFRVGLLPPGHTWHIDDIRIRRYVSNEPVTTLGPLDRN